MKQKILVIGATGMLGEPVARHLQRQGFAVRVGSRSFDKARDRFGGSFEHVECNVRNTESIRAALDGCDGVHINLNGGPDPGDHDRIDHRGTANVAAAAATAGISRLTYLSGISAREENRFFAPTAAKLDAATAIQASGVPFTIFRPTWFFESLKFFVRDGQAGILGSQPHPLRWLAADDYARMVANAYRTPAAAGQILDILGPEPLTMLDALKRYCAVCHPDLTPRSVPFWQAEIAAKMPGNEGIRDAIPLMRFFEKFIEGGDPSDADRLLGTPTTTLDEWLARGSGP